MGKLLFWAVVIVAVLVGVRLLNIMQGNARRRRDDGDDPHHGASSRRGRAKPADEAMVRCVRCGVFLPRSEARLLHDGYHCRDAACNRHS